MQSKKTLSVWKRAALGLLLILLVAVLLYLLPSVRERIDWRIEQLELRVGYLLNPPGKVVFVPTQAGLAPPQITRVQLTLSPTEQPPPDTDLVGTPLPTVIETETVKPMPTPTEAPLPAKVALEGVVFQDQHMGRRNYCAPANLAMALSYWGWSGDQFVVGPMIKPDDEDKNVMPYEMADYVEGHTELGVVLRTGGNLDVIRRFLAAGYPLLIEKGVYFDDITGVVSWMGHYQVITGYDDETEIFLIQDLFLGENTKVSYADTLSEWRAFNYTYLVIFPSEKEEEVMRLLGSDSAETVNHSNTALLASNEIYGLSGIDQYFAWFNRGSSLVALEDFGGAAVAYDEAFKLYPAIPEAKRPWRMLWYQTGPYFAYYGVQRYYDLLYLADGTLAAMQGEKNLEESYYWRGMARAALADREGAIQDFQTSLKYHPDFEPAVYQLRLLGVEIP